MLVDADAGVALAWAERLRELLVAALASRTTPGFTVSLGIVDSTGPRSVEALVRLADAALYRAKSEGRDRAVVANAQPGDGLTPQRRRSEHNAAIDLHAVVGPA